MLVKAEPARFDCCRTIFGHDCHYSPESIYRDVPEFRPRISLAEGMRHVIATMDSENRILDSGTETWEDEIISGIKSGSSLKRLD